MSLSITNRTIDKYFKFLSSLDNSSKKKLIIKLTESITEKGKKRVSLDELSGKWEDSRESDEIIKEIRNSRVEKQVNIDL